MRIEQTGDATLYLGDCREILPTLGKVDAEYDDDPYAGGRFNVDGCYSRAGWAILTDPPYGIFKNTGGDGKMFGKETIYSIDDKAAQWDSRPDDDLLRSLMKFKEYVIWGGNYFADVLGASKGVLVWDKKTGNNSYADCELAWTNATGTTRILHHQWCGAFKDSERGERSVHPTQKPIAVMAWAIGFCKSDTILDPFMGSGTTGVACAKMGKKFIGIELDEDYFNIACRRIEEAYKQPDLFIEPPVKQEQYGFL